MAEFKEFEPRLKFETQLKYGWFHLKSFSMFQDLSRAQLKPVFGGFEMRLKFIEFGLENGYSILAAFNSFLKINAF